MIEQTFTRSKLSYRHYNWDDTYSSNSSDAFSRSNGHHVLNLINDILQELNAPADKIGTQLEKMIKRKLPFNITKISEAKTWLIQNINT